MTSSIIRLATLQDAQAIARVHIRSWQKMYSEFIPETILDNLSVDERTQQWQQLLEEQVKILVLEIDNQIVGFASICTFRDFMADQSMGEISAIYLDPDYWRLGLGTKLCWAALTELENSGYKTVFLWVLKDNLQACKFYEALGFTLTDLTKLEEFYEGGALLTQVLYKKKL
ncbi:Phosphinothricin N-acetyltransferase [Legionella massiliensis]|uniref:Phosphinothricin N-acetyltransferase n=1 Tax=Legionella massiliensis TaxID=1034943 RepID=A0A078KQ57_9GAMM|nr:GNAT family N-acetyltransferase [Legionella massiliensis]CDZ76505.1 Phosphinothricin N-acetyltransferase [Legionella massiliensis]CEE12243.1 Phosphinothricin N-acetyltransferase [Legionella massiliensis]